MQLFVIFLLLHGAFAQYEFGNSYLKNSKLCKPWSCINSHLGFGDALPSRESYSAVLKSLLPEEWHGTVSDVLEVCYGETKPRAYTSTCPGQAMLHCVVDNLIDKCPESALVKDDACAPMTSLAGFNYMFSQSRYENLQKYLPTERRPEWFLKNYFSANCCDLPPLFNASLLSDCGFHSMLHYYGHLPRAKVPSLHMYKTVFKPHPKVEDVQFVELKDSDDPLDCCDISDFVPTSVRNECNFKTTWDSQKRLIIQNTQPEITTTTTERPVSTTVIPIETKHHDVKVVPLSCESETCIFKKLKVITDIGSVVMDAFSKLLDSMTEAHPEWAKAKARVLTTCVSRNLSNYHEPCVINSLLACTFDVLSENCPHAKKTSDPCKHTRDMKNDTMCQINSSKFRAKNRRQFCDFPRFVDPDVLSECGVTSISRIESVPTTVTKPVGTFRSWLPNKPFCNDSLPSTKCLMNKIGVLNKYNFIDYFKVKEQVRQFSSKHSEWVALNDVVISTFSTMPFYKEYCISSRKIMNVIDAILMTCPVHRRKNTDKCKKMFNDMASNKPQPKEKLNKIYEHMFMEANKRAADANSIQVPKKHNSKDNGEKGPKKFHPLLGYAIFSNNKIPPVKIINITPQPNLKANQKPLVLLPVYQRYPLYTFEQKSMAKLEPEFLPPFRRDALLRSAGISPPNPIDDGHTGRDFGFAKPE